VTVSLGLRTTSGWSRVRVAAPLCALVLGGCAAGATTSDPAPTTPASTTPAPSTTTDTATSAAPAPETRSPTTPSPTPSDVFTAPGTAPVADLADAELADLGVNELGRVLVMEWHKLGDTDGRWENSLDTFRAQLQELHDKGFRPISVPEFVAGTFPIPAGTAPVLLTFDDSYKSHMYFGPDGETPADDSVVGILQAMERQDPTWRARANFAYYWPAPFREPDRDLIAKKMNYLVDHGFDLSNHTYNHDDLSKLTDAEVVENLAKNESELADMVGPDYRVRSITLTQGIWPNNEDLAMDGEWNGFAYHHDVAFEVGYMPTRSPHHAEYDPRDVMRVQAYLPEFRKWMDWFDEDPSRRFVSDGDPTTVTYPSNFQDVVGNTDGFDVRVYDVPATPTADTTS
jgi:peptidoglycan/xylan/chitin deacetylase (PgdA/CDA1 family)